MEKPKNKKSSAALSLFPLVNLSSLSPNAHLRVSVCINEGGRLPIYAHQVTDLKPNWADLLP